jgi:small subunit ribosomal protein S6e
MQLVIADTKTGKTYKAEVPKGREAELTGKKIGEVIDAGFVGAGGYKIELTGGSDGSGFPMRKDITGTRKTKALITKGVGFRAEESGERRKKVVRGNSYSADIVQVNCKIAEYGPTPLDQIFKTEEKKEEKK